MPGIEKMVAAKLQSLPDNDATLALWTKIWAAYEAGGLDGAKALLESLADAAPAEGD